MTWRSKYPQAKSASDLKSNKYYKSWLPEKKLVIKVVRGNKSKVIHFGQKGYEDYTEHKDKSRRANYRARASKIRDKNGKLTVNNPFRANYHAYRVLW